jgi:hypothetical protein
MTPLALRLVVAVVRAWTRAYTFGLPSSIRDARRAEVESDLWECRADDAATLPLQIFGRLVLGVVDDLCWRVEGASTGARNVRDAMVVAFTAALAVACVWVALVHRPAAQPQPPAAPDVRWSRHQLPPPPPPPPPPCNPPGIGRKPFSPCTPN